MMLRISDWDITSVFKMFVLLFLGSVYLTLHLLILIMAYTLNVSIAEGIDMNTALTPLHAAVMSDDWLNAYYLVRENVLAEFPVYSLIEKLFIRRSGLTYSDLWFDFVKASLCGSLSYLFCRFNLLLSSKKSPLLFSAATYLWTSLSMFGSMILITLFKTFSPTVRNIMCIGTLLCSMLLVSVLSYINLGDVISFSKLFLKNFNSLLIGTLDSLYYYLVSCFIFDILHTHVSDQFVLIFLVLFTSGITGLLYSYIKNTILS